MWFFSSFISCNFTFFLIIALLYVDIIDNLKNEKKNCSYTANKANIEAFCWNILFSATLISEE